MCPYQDVHVGVGGCFVTGDWCLSCRQVLGGTDRYSGPDRWAAYQLGGWCFMVNYLHRDLCVTGICISFSAHACLLVCVRMDRTETLVAQTHNMRNNCTLVLL